MRLPVALELLELLATVNIPQPDRLVTRPTDDLRWIRRVEPDGIDVIAAIVSNVSLLVTSLRLTPGEGGQHATLRKMQPPVALERLQALACARVPELHRLVPARTGEQPVNRPVYAGNWAAAIFSNVS